MIDYRLQLQIPILFPLHGFIDKNGRLAIDPQYDWADRFSGGLARVIVNAKFGFIDKIGRMVIEPQFEDAGDFSEGLAAIQIQLNGKYGFIDKTGRIAIEPKYDWAERFSEGLAQIGLSSGKVYIDKTGKIVRKVSETNFR